MRVCKNEQCLKEFAPGKHNQIYCSPECCKIVTQKRIAEKNRLEQDSIKQKICRGKGCKTILSRYNKGRLCNSCKKQKQADLNKIARGVFNEIARATATGK